MGKSIKNLVCQIWQHRMKLYNFLNNEIHTYRDFGNNDKSIIIEDQI
jgi:hypothetical protein